MTHEVPQVGLVVLTAGIARDAATYISSGEMLLFGCGGET